MTREELKPALEWAQQVAEDKNGAKGLFSATGDMEIVARFVTTQKHVTSLASALREAWAEIDRLKALKPNYGGWIEYKGVGHYDLHIEPPVDPLDEALNSGDGSYKP
jgi:hypothetical protein